MGPALTVLTYCDRVWLLLKSGTNGRFSSDTAGWAALFVFLHACYINTWVCWAAYPCLLSDPRKTRFLRSDSVRETHNTVEIVKLDQRQCVIKPQGVLTGVGTESFGRHLEPLITLEGERRRWKISKIFRTPGWWPVALWVMRRLRCPSKVMRRFGWRSRHIHSAIGWTTSWRKRASTLKTWARTYATVSGWWLLLRCCKRGSYAMYCAQLTNIKCLRTQLLLSTPSLLTALSLSILVSISFIRRSLDYL